MQDKTALMVASIAILDLQERVEKLEAIVAKLEKEAKDNG
jgi:hypothetical protein